MRLNATKLGSIANSRSFGDQLFDLAGEVPNLDLNFAGTKTLDPRISFTRASTGTYVGSDGLIKSATTNEARFDHNPTTVESLGLLVEEARTNLVLQSNQFNTTWTNSDTSETSAAGIAPDGTNTAWELKDSLDIVPTIHGLVQAVSFVSGTSYTFTCWMKAGTLTQGGFAFPAAAFTTGLSCRVDLSTGSIIASSSGLSTSTTVYANGWVRVISVATATASVASSITIRILNNANSYIGTGTGTILIWGAQIEASSTAGDYVPTTSVINSAPRFDHNPTTGESLGLLVEEPRTNLSLYSEDFTDASWTKTDCTITANNSTAPDGTTTADLWTNILSAGGAINNSITKDATARTYTVTMWVKGTASLFTFTLDFGGTTNRGRAQFNLATNTVVGTTNTGNFTGTSASITAYPGGWARLTMTTTTSTGTTIRFRPFFGTGGESVYIWGAQVEEGAFATSYIPTTTATATRAADVASITGTNFSSFYNQTEGTVFADAKVATVPPATSLSSVFALSDGTTSNRIAVYKRANADTSTRLDVQTSGSSVAFINAGTFSVFNLIAASYRVDDFAISLNGLTPGTDTLGAIPTVSRLNIGNYADSTLPLNGTIKRLTYWPVRLANPTLQSITQP